jgi:putative two-component system response regulator
MVKETLLIVEDNLALREGLSDILAYEGYEVLAAENGLEALDQMQSAVPDLILSDIAMPGMDGIAFFNQVRTNPAWISIPFIFLTARGEKEDIMNSRNLGAEDYLVKPLSRDELLTTVRARLVRSRQLRVAQLQKAYEASLTALANSIERRSHYTHGHVDRVTAYAIALATRIDWQDRTLEQLRLGAILHDIGKIQIRESVLFKKSPLTDSEWREIRRHPINGADMIKRIPFLVQAIPVVRHHHERWDGQGYPDRLAGGAIPLGARIVAIADSFDVMTSEQPYRAAIDLPTAYAEVVAESGKQFDPKLVAAFQACWEAGEIQGIHEDWRTKTRA